MLELPTVTLVCADCVDVARVVKVLDHCQSLCRFGAVKFLTSLPTDYPHRVQIDPLVDHISYSAFMVKRVHAFIPTAHMLVVQHDAWVLHPESWDPLWLGFDYIAPLFNQYNSVGSGGFSLRSKALMIYVDQHSSGWDGTPEGAVRLHEQLGCYEDGVVSSMSTQAGFRRAPLEVAARFARCGNADPRYHVPKPFGFHRWTNAAAADAASLL